MTFRTDCPIPKFEEITSARTFCVPELAESAARNAWTEDRRQYRVWLDGQEAAFVTFDTFFPDRLNLYEIVVAKTLRKRGIGSSIICFAVGLARTIGKTRLTIRAGQIEEGVTKQELRGFYKRRGLIPNPYDPDLFEIEV